jgi:hypothetical protein
MRRISKSILGRVAGVLLASVLVMVGLVAFASGSSATPTNKTVKTSNAYVFAQCSLAITGFDFNGNNVGYLSAQSQSQLLGGFVKSTAISCVATNAANQFVDSFTYVGTGPTLLNTRKNGTYPISPTYHLCTYLTVFFYTGGSTTQHACN